MVRVQSGAFKNSDLALGQLDNLFQGQRHEGLQVMPLHLKTNPFNYKPYLDNVLLVQLAQ